MLSGAGIGGVGRCKARPGFARGGGRHRRCAGWRGGVKQLRATADDGARGRGPNGSRDLEELQQELAKMDLDAVTQQFGDNFGPRPDFFQETTVEDVKSQFENLIDLEEVGGVFSSEKAGNVKLSDLEQHDASEEEWADKAKAAEEAEADLDDEEERKKIDDWGAKMGWEPATEEHERMWKEVEASVRASDPLADVPKEEYEEMSNFIMKLVHAGDQFDSIVDENIHRIDQKLLALLERRMSLSVQESDMRVVQGLQNIWKRLAAEMERRDAPDELKLLDTCLTIMMPDDPMQEFDPKVMLARKGEVVELLEEAFALPGSRHRPVDVFEMARKIGPQQSLNIDELEAQHGDIWGSDVTRESFIEMVGEVIRETQERQAEEKGVLQDIKHELETMEYTDEEKRMGKEEIEKMYREMDAQKRVLGVTREIMQMAQAMTWI